VAVRIENTLDELVRAGALLSGQHSFKGMISVLVEQTMDISRSDLACLYLRCPDEEGREPPLRLMFRRGRYRPPEQIPTSDPAAAFLEESNEAVVLLERRTGPFEGLLLHPDMASAIAAPLSTPAVWLGFLVLNSLQPAFYGRQALRFLDSYAKLAGGILQGSRLLQELQESLRHIRALERYQASIFASMTNLLVTTDREGRIAYFNRSAGRSLGLGDGDLGKPLEQAFAGHLHPRLLKAAREAAVGSLREELTGLKGIYRRGGVDMDFSLNLSPLSGPRGGHEGLTLLFSDQSREQELAGRVRQVTEERRVIKDMFARYLSAELVSRLVDAPEMVNLGGDKHEATIFFADIRGYTAFAEGKDPEYIVQVLNEYFSEAVEAVVRHGGYIDKFIGDCIMAAWGVPLQTAEQDAVRAVACALEIQQMVRSGKRRFFRGAASGLKVGIGAHTGPIVAGNLGSRRRMDYTVIGDTVNLASRLEGIAAAEEVIVTQDTVERLGGRFKVEPRAAVTVKGKSRPIPVYRVLKQIS
jgi:adenylate cyclase